MTVMGTVEILRKSRNGCGSNECSKTCRRFLGNFGEFVPGGEADRELLAVERSAQQIALQCEVLSVRSSTGMCACVADHESRAYVARVHVWFGGFSARLFSRAAALTNTCLTFTNSGIAAFAAG